MTMEDGGERATLGVASRWLLGLLYLLPKNAISRAMGWLAARRLPPPLQRFELELFVRLAGIDRSELAQPLERYPSLQQLFTRALAPGARPLEGGDEVLASPCDGAWGTAGRIENGTLLQVKGRRYRVADLIGDEGLAARYEGGEFATLYLSPRDYHRFHTPAAGRITRLVYCPGALWPVNSIGLLGIDGLFARNERICAFLEVRQLGVGPLEAGQLEVEGRRTGDRGDDRSTPLVMVAVGATMVGSVRLAFDGLATNRRGAMPEDRSLGESGPILARGAEWGHFEFGSTIVLLIPPCTYRLEPRPIGTPLRLGRAIGRLAPTT